jgi:hypothetical protein
VWNRIGIVRRRWFTQRSSGARPSLSAASCTLAAVARFICFISAPGETEKAKQTTRASHSSYSSFSIGSRVVT